MIVVVVLTLDGYFSIEIYIICVDYFGRASRIQDGPHQFGARRKSFGRQILQGGRASIYSNVAVICANVDTVQVNRRATRRG